MLQDASNVALIGDAPWALAPAAAIFMVVLGVNLLVQSTGRGACTIGTMKPFAGIYTPIATPFCDDGDGG
jgi:hypothetical protein